MGPKLRPLLLILVLIVLISRLVLGGLQPSGPGPGDPARLLANPGAEVAIDLESTTLTLPDGRAVKFPIEPFARVCLLNGVDELGFLLSKDPAIRAYEARHPA